MKDFLSAQFRFLTFRGLPDGDQGYGLKLFFYSGAITWLVGMGRYWDNPKAKIWQMAGLGSLSYVFIFGTALWLIMLPMRPRDKRWSTLLLFMMMTSAPGLLYAIPVEQFMTLKNGQSANIAFLAVVAIWRVALWFHFLIKHQRIPWPQTLLIVLLPIMIIVTCLAMLNLEHVVFRIMGGVREWEKTPNDAAYMVVLLLTVLSVYGSPIVGIAYIVGICFRWSSRKSAPESAPPLCPTPDTSKEFSNPMD